MTNPFRISVVVLLLALGMTVTFTTLEALTSDDPLEIGDIIVDFLEALCVAGAMIFSASFVTRMRDIESATTRLSRDVADASAAGAAWRRQSQRLMEGLGAAISVQFDEWRLTEAERDIAALILKGMSLKEIAQARATSEPTIRQQAGSVYRKSGLNNRAELAAYFLDDLFVAGFEQVRPDSEATRRN